MEGMGQFPDKNVKNKNKKKHQRHGSMNNSCNFNDKKKY
jgi:hypothetical protein